MLTLPSALSTALARGGLSVLVYVKIEKSFTIEAVNRAWLSYTPGIDRVTPFSADLDALDRKSKIGGFSVTSNNDGWLYGLALANEFRGARVTVKWGDISATSTSDLAPLFKGTCESPLTDEISGAVTLSCSDYLSSARDGQIVGRFLNVHPLEVIESVLTSADGGLDLDTSIVDLTSLDPTSHDDIQHFVISRGMVSDHYRDTSLSTPTSAKQIVDDLAMLMDGQLVCREDGIISFQRFKSGTAAVDDWTDDDFISEPKLTDPGSVYNQVALDLTQAESQTTNSRGVLSDFATPKALTFRQTNTDSADDLASPDQGKRVIAKNYDTDWLESASFIIGTSGSVSGDYLPAAATAGDWVLIGEGILHAFCGTRMPGFTGAGGSASYTEPTTLKLDDDHLAYIRFDDEIVSFDRCEVHDQNVAFAYPDDVFWPPTETIDFISEVQSLPGWARFRIAERGVLGTDAADHFGTITVTETPFPCHDVTIATQFVSAKLQRHGRGAPKISVRTTLRKYALQLGDIITLTTDKVKYYGRSDGIDDFDKWEITSKNVDLFGDEPSITWGLTWAYEDTGDPTGDLIETSVGDRTRRIPSTGADDSSRVLKPTLLGGEPTDGGGLSIDIGSGRIASKYGNRVRPAISAPIAASSDNHVFFDERSGGVHVLAVPVGDPAPVLSTSNTRVAVVTTDGSGVTAITDQRNLDQPIVDDAVTVKATLDLIANRTFSSFSRG